MSLRILILMNRVPWPLKDGGSIAMYNALKAYHDAGCEVTVAALNTSKHHQHITSLPPQVSNLAEWHATEIDNRVKPLAAFLNLFSNRSYHIERFISTEFASLVTRILKQKVFDVVIFENLFVAPYLETVSSNTKALLVLRQHNVEHKIWQSLARNESNPLKKWYLNLLTKRLENFEKQVLNKFDLLLAFTHDDKQIFKAMGCTQPIEVAPAGIDTKRLKPDVSLLQKDTLFHLGSLDWRPNMEAVEWFLANVWSKLSARLPKLKLVIAGRGMPVTLKSRAVQNAEMMGEVTDAVAFMNSYQIMVVPLFSGSGIRVKILEGLALGKVIVSTTAGAQGIDFENGRHLLIADTADEFISVIEKITTNAQLAAAISKQARELAETKYDNTKVTAGLLSIYNKLISKK